MYYLNQKISWQRVQLLEQRYYHLRKALILLVLSPGILTLFFGVSLPMWFISACLACAIRIFRYLKTLTCEMKILSQGLEAEDLVFQCLSLLPPDWKMERRVVVGHADIDLLVTSPQGVVIAVEVKSHRGEIQFKKNSLVRMGYFGLEGDFLEILRKRSQLLAVERGLPSITCIIVFTQAKLFVPNASIDGVFVRDLSGLMPLLHSLDTNTRKFNALRSGRKYIDVVAEKEAKYELSSQLQPLSLEMLLERMNFDSSLLTLTSYKVKRHICYKCSQPIVVFSWEGHTMWPDDMPPQPSPRSIKFRYCQSLQKRYWVNTCQSCGATLGDSFVYKNANDWSAVNGLNLQYQQIM